MARFLMSIERPHLTEHVLFHNGTYEEAHP